MKTVGIIAEYNPFHNGHKFHIEEAKRLTQADRVIVVMSGDFVQRGEPAVIDKYSRTRMALSYGADAVFELPHYYALGSAEYFALGAISLLDKLGIVDSICFGSECGNVMKLREIAEVLMKEPIQYQEALKEGLRNGMTFPAASAYAISDYFQDEEITEIISLPNNILGIYYMKALLKRNSSMTPYTLLRYGSHYRDEALSSDPKIPISSALAIRTALSGTGTLSDIEVQLPSLVYQELSECMDHSFPVKADDFSTMLGYKLLENGDRDLTSYVDISESLSDRISNEFKHYQTFSDFCERLKTKDFTYARISRCLMHILLDMKTETLADYIRNDYVSYARLLGFRNSSADILTAAKAHGSLTLISKPADAKNILSPMSLSMFKEDVYVSHIYQIVIASKYNTPYRNEYSRKMIKV